MRANSVENIAIGYLGFGTVKFAGYSLYGIYLAKQYRQESKPVQFDQHNQVAQDLPCKLCGYNLRTLPEDGKCPECGGSVAVTIRVRSTRQLPDLHTNPLFVGFLRTIIGLAFGTLYWHTVGPIAGLYGHLGLLPLRVIEWWLLVIILFDARVKFIGRGWKIVGFGVIVSYLLDIPAIAGFCMTGGAWIC